MVHTSTEGGRGKLCLCQFMTNTNLRKKYKTWIWINWHANQYHPDKHFDTWSGRSYTQFVRWFTQLGLPFCGISIKLFLMFNNSLGFIGPKLHPRDYRKNAFLLGTCVLYQVSRFSCSPSWHVTRESFTTSTLFARLLACDTQAWMKWDMWCQ